MDRISKEISEIEKQIEDALWALEMQDNIEKALEEYRESERRLMAIEIKNEGFAYTERQRVLAYCLMRQGNLLRQKGKSDEALELSDREIVAARASEDEIMLGRSLMSNGTNLIIAGETSKGMSMLEEACKLFETGESYDHQQGLGWYWILQADLANAGIIEKKPFEVVTIADRIIEILKPIENWPGVARGYAARAKAHESIGKEGDAAEDRREQKYYEGMIETEERNDS